MPDLLSEVAETEDEQNLEASLPIGDAAVGTDRFYQGIISKLFPRNNMGMVRTFTGREVPFSYQLVVLRGAIADTKDLAEGMAVGFDLGWTSDGLRVTKIKTYEPRPESRVENPVSEIEESG